MLYGTRQDFKKNVLIVDDNTLQCSLQFWAGETEKCVFSFGLPGCLMPLLRLLCLLISLLESLSEQAVSYRGVFRLNNQETQATMRECFH